jgi:hypothetical protein
MRGKLAALMALASLFAALAWTPASAAAPEGLVMSQMGSVVGHRYDQPLPPKGQTPQQRAAWLLDRRPALGRAPSDWLAWSKGTFTLGANAPAARPAAEGATAAAARNLIANVAALDALAGAPLSGAQRAQVAADAARIPAQVRAPFASLVGTVAAAYAAQVPTAHAILARLRPGVDLATLVTRAERDAMTARQTAIVRALDVFRARTSAFFDASPSLPRIFADPNGLVILGGTGNDTYNRAEGQFPDPILLVDPSGNDTYNNSAGGACPLWPLPVPVHLIGNSGDDWLACNGLVLSVVADLGDGTTAASNDRYHYDGAPSAVQGAGGPGGIGILVDVAGADTYDAKMTRGDNAPFFMYFDGGAQGYGFGGAGLLLDGTGDDTYRFDVYSAKGHSIWALGQGFGGAGGIGIATDLSGNDHWLSDGLGLRGGGFEGIYVDGVGFYGGVGILTDLGGGDDVVRSAVVADTVDFYSQGFAAFGGLGVMVDDGGDDSYYTLEKAISPAPGIDPLLNCAYGTASYGGVGIMIDGGGNDTYYGASISTLGAFVMDNGWGGPAVGYGLFVDASGDDSYTMEAQGKTPMIAGRGDQGLDSEPNWFGTFVDGGGKDSYVGGAGADDTTWLWMGVDENS